MGLQDREERELAEIEQHLADDDPRFDGKLSGMNSATSRPFRLTLIILSVSAIYVTGLGVIIGGVSSSSVVLIVLGGLIATSVPVTLTVRAFRDRRA